MSTYQIIDNRPLDSLFVCLLLGLFSLLQLLQSFPLLLGGQFSCFRLPHGVCLACVSRVNCVSVFEAERVKASVRTLDVDVVYEFVDNVLDLLQVIVVIVVALKVVSQLEEPNSIQQQQQHKMEG